MTLRHLKIFVSVCDCGGVTRAAELLHISQPAISHTVAELERYYNITLFERINQRLVLTEAGREVLGKARALVESFDDFEAFVARGSNDPRVRIGCSLTLGQTVIPSFLRKVADEHPDLEPHVMIRSSALLEQELENGNLDLALIEGEVRSPYLRSEPYKKDRLLTVANIASKLPDKASLEELIQYPWLLRERGSTSREALERALAPMRLRIDPLIESSNNHAIVAALYANLGLALLPESFVEGHIARGKFKEITVTNFDGNRTSYLVMHKNKKLNASGKKILELLK